MHHQNEVAADAAGAGDAVALTLALAVDAVDTVALHKQKREGTVVEVVVQVPYV